MRVWSGFGGLRRCPGWTPGSWGRTPGGGLLAGPLDSGQTPGFWLDPWILPWILDFVRFPRFRQILEFLADFGAGGQILVLEVILITSCAYRIILGIIYPLEMLFLTFVCFVCWPYITSKTFRSLSYWPANCGGLTYIQPLSQVRVYSLEHPISFYEGCVKLITIVATGSTSNCQLHCQNFVMDL